VHSGPLWRNVKERGHFENLVVGGEDNIKIDAKEISLESLE
jgi:hypothetical protein